MRKDMYFGAALLIQKAGKPDRLEVSDFLNGQCLVMHDAEIKEREDSPEVVSFIVYDADEKMSEVFIHKKDCLQIASFLLNIHTEYAGKINELNFNDYLKQHSVED